ncbi:MAG: TraB/GumN family protein [Chitinophagaceae bacterium]|nr:TraB/GumN family protein [Chitinophagaceae bacterium]
MKSNYLFRTTGTMLCLFLLLFSSVPSPAQEKKNNARLWEISGNGLTQPSYLFGTIHMICKEDFVLSDIVKEKFNASKEIYLELDMDDPKLQVTIMQLMQLPGKETLQEKMGAAKFSRLDSFVKKEMKMNLAAFARFKPLMLMSLLAQRSVGCQAIESYENTFVKMSREQKKELLGLERVEDQVAVFDAIPDSVEIESIMKFVNDFEKGKKEFKGFINIYLSQDLDALYQVMAELPEMMGSLELLLNRRNRNWIPVMDAAMKKSPTFFAVGAGHLGGSQGVLELLRKQGYQVRALR